MKFSRDKHGILFVVSAPSGGGKTSLCKEVIKRLPNFEHGISYTTRTCTNCGYLNKVGACKTIDCKGCDLKIDRDFNGARNIYLKGLDTVL